MTESSKTKFQRGHLDSMRHTNTYVNTYTHEHTHRKSGSMIFVDARQTEENEQ